MSKKLIFLLLAAVWVAVPSAVASLKYDTLTSADGLSNSSVNCIYQDSTLMMWFGTWDGLNAYNGYGFRTYKFAPDNANTISNNVIRNIVEEAKGSSGSPPTTGSTASTWKTTHRTLLPRL